VRLYESVPPELRDQHRTDPCRLRYTREATQGRLAVRDVLKNWRGPGNVPDVAGPQFLADCTRLVLAAVMAAAVIGSGVLRQTTSSDFEPRPRSGRGCGSPMIRR